MFSLVGIGNQFFLSDSLSINPWAFFHVHFSTDMNATPQSNISSSQAEKATQSTAAEHQRHKDSKIPQFSSDKAKKNSLPNQGAKVTPNSKKQPAREYRKGKIFAEQNKKVPVPLPEPLEGRPETDPRWCTMANYRSDYWKNSGLEKEMDHNMLQKMEMSFPGACVKDGLLHVPKDSLDSFERWKIKWKKTTFLVSGFRKDGTVYPKEWSDVLYPYIKVVEEDMTKWGLPMDEADALVSISNYVDYLAEFYKNGIVYLWALFKYKIITENMWFVPILPSSPDHPLGWLPGYMESLTRPYTKRCLMRFSTWLQHNRCYPRVHIRHWTSTNWTNNYPWEFREEYTEVAKRILDYYDIKRDFRPKDRIRIGVIKRNGNRKAMNHDEIVEKCNQEIVDPVGGSVECISLDIIATDPAAMKLIRSLHVLVGVHGAGLLNGIFMNQGSGVLELFPVKVASWNFIIYTNDLKIGDSPWLHYEGLHFCDLNLTDPRGFYDRRWQTTSQIYPWQHVRRRLQNVVNHLGDITYPVVVESVPGPFHSPVCEKGTTVSYTSGQTLVRNERSALTHEYLGLPSTANWTVKTLKPDKRL